MINPNCIQTNDRFIDLTHLMHDDIDVFPGDIAFKTELLCSVKNDGYANTKVTMGMHVGTHMDAPAHMINGGKKLSDYHVDRFFGYCDVLDVVENDGVISEKFIEQLPKQNADFLLIRTDHSRFFGENVYYEEYPILSIEFAKKIVQLDYRLVGLDTPSPDQMPYEIHQLFLENDILLVENLKDLDRLPPSKEVFLTILPLKILADSAPVRAIVELL